MQRFVTTLPKVIQCYGMLLCAVLLVLICNDFVFAQDNNKGKS